MFLRTPLIINGKWIASPDDDDPFDLINHYNEHLRQVEIASQESLKTLRTIDDLITLVK